jgi:hypothetical protein
MNARLVLLMFSAPSVVLAADGRDPTSLTLSGPSVVILRADDAEVAKIKFDHGFVEFEADFGANSSRLVEAMKSQPQIKVVASSAQTVRFSDQTVAPILRGNIETRYGYLFYRPGEPPRVYSGVRPSDGLICEAARMFQVAFKGHHCEP